MRSTGIEALDARLGGLAAGRYYLLWGPSGAGKTSAALHFLGAGLAEGDVCAIISQDDPSDLLAQAEHLGYDLRPAIEQDRLRILKFRLDFQRNFGRVFDADMVFREAELLLGDPVPDRLVIDSIYPFIEGVHGTDALLDGLAAFLERYPGVVYLTVPGDLGDAVYRRIYNRVTAGTAGIFEFKVHEGRSREIAIRKLRQPSNFTDPFRFVIRPGAGIVEEPVYESGDALPEPYRRRVLILCEDSPAPAELVSALEARYDVKVHGTVETAFADLVAGLYGALLICLSPLDPESALELTRSLRKAGNGVPILFYASGRGLRSSTRAEGIRVGGDDFLTDALPPHELLERIERARSRGHRRIPMGGAPERVTLQPVEEGGRHRLMTEREFLTVVAERHESGAEPFFAVVVLNPTPHDVERAWELLRDRVRIGEGDLIARLKGERIGIFFHDVGYDLANELVARLGDVDPAFGEGAVELFIRHPVERAALEAWLAAGGARPAESAVQG